MNYQAIFFDFDGVILDSVHVKTKAFAAMFRQHGPEIEQAVVDYHLQNGGVSRYKKFEYYYKELLKKNIDQDTLDTLGQEFENLTLQGVLEEEQGDSHFLDFSSTPGYASAISTRQQLSGGDPCPV